jgi:hypothetical protein
MPPIVGRSFPQKQKGWGETVGLEVRHSFASIGNDLGFTQATIAALVGHSRGTVTSRCIRTVDTALIMAADSIAGCIQGLLSGVAFTHTAYALDRDSRKSALAHFLGQTGTAVVEVDHAVACLSDGQPVHPSTYKGPLCHHVWTAPCWQERL